MPNTNSTPAQFRQLSETETAEFRRWARDNYTPGAPINPTWHPVTRDEAAAMNNEATRCKPYNRFQVAIDILDAGNMRAIAREFVKIVDAAAEELQSTTAVWTDPAVVLLVTKLSELSGANRPEAFSAAYAEAQRRCSN